MSTRTRTRWTAIAAAVGLVVTVASVTAVLLLRPGACTPAPVVGYASSPDGRDLALVVVVGPSDRVVKAEVVAAEARSVRVRVCVKRSTENQPSLGVRRTTSVSLAEPLGDRRVLDDSGTEVVRS